MPTNFPTSVDNFTNPTANDSLNLPSHSTQHANANDAIEAIESYLLNGTGAGWQSYTPTLSGGWANGNGTWDAQYTQLGKTVFWRGLFTVGSTTTKGSIMVLSLPVTAETSNVINAAGYLVTGSTRYVAAVSYDSTTTLKVGTSVASATYTTFNDITATTPFTWATGNVVMLSGTYQAA